MGTLTGTRMDIVIVVVQAPVPMQAGLLASITRIHACLGLGLILRTRHQQDVIYRLIKVTWQPQLFF